MNVRGDFLKTPHSTNTTALICKSRKENPQKPTQLSSSLTEYPACYSNLERTLPMLLENV